MRKRDGTLTLVGAPETPASVNGFGLLFRRRRLAGSLIGGIKETQDVLDFCAERGITADVEVIPMQQINDAYERLPPTRTSGPGSAGRRTMMARR